MTLPIEDKSSRKPKIIKGHLVLGGPAPLDGPAPITSPQDTMVGPMDAPITPWTTRGRPGLRRRV